MRTLSATLLEAQRSGSGRPHVRVELYDLDVGVIRLRWERWYEGTEADGPSGAAVPADGSLLRARIDPADGALSHQRVAAPAQSSDFSAWTSLGTVATAPRLGLSAAGTRAMLATVRTNGTSVEVRESTDSGASFGSSSVVATAASTVAAVTCGVQSDGSAAVLYAVEPQQTDTGLVSPGTAVNDNSQGGIQWNGLTSALASDDARATSAVVSGLPDTSLLKVTNFGFSVPDEASILGIEVSIERRKSGVGEGRDDVLQAVKGGSLAGDDRASTTPWPTSDGTAVYGGSADTWGEQWTPADVNDTAFGVALSARLTSGSSGTFEVDHIQIRVFYLLPATVHVTTREGSGGNWSQPEQWTNSLATVSGLVAYFENDYNVLVSGATAAGDEGAWATAFGAGGAEPAGSWSSLVEVALASEGTDVSYRATGVARAGVPRALMVESFSGAGAYDRVHIASGVAQTAYLDALWRDPQPFDHASPYGLTVAAALAHAWLCAPDGVWHADVGAPVVDLTDDVLEAEIDQRLDGGRLRLVLRNDDGRYNRDTAPVALAPGGELVIGPGYETAAGAEVSEGLIFWIRSTTRRRRGGTSTVELEAVDGWGLLRAWTAPTQLVWTAGSKNAFQVLSDIVRRVGLRLSGHGGSIEAGALQPAFTVRAGERGATAVLRLLEVLPDRVLMNRTDALLVEPKVTDATDYAFGGFPGGHAVLELRAEQGRPAAGWARVFGDGVFAEAVDGVALRDGAGTAIAVDDNLTAQARADVRATTLLRQEALAVQRGELVAPPNVAQELGDVIEVTDPTLGLDAARYRVGALRLRFVRGGARPLYEMRLSLTEV